MPKRYTKSADYYSSFINFDCDHPTIVYSVRGLEWSELGGSHGCQGRLWGRLLWQVYQNDSRHDDMDGV